MVLEAPVIAWFGRVAKLDLRPDCLQRTYNFQHHLNARQETTVCRVLGDDRCEWKIRFFTPTEATVLEKPLERLLLVDHHLWGEHHVARDGSRARGLVLWSALVLVCEEFQAKGFTRALCEAEDSLLASWGVRQVQLCADWSGRWVWVQKFRFKFREAATVALDYIEWAAEDRENRPQLPPDDPARYPTAFLASLAAPMLYKDISP